MVVTIVAAFAIERTSCTNDLSVFRRVDRKQQQMIAAGVGLHLQNFRRSRPSKKIPLVECGLQDFHVVARWSDHQKLAASEEVRVAGQVKVLLVEDSSVLAERVTDVLMQIPDIDLIGVVDSEAAALAKIRKGRVHVVLLDLYLKQGTGFGILRAISNMDRKPRIIVLTNHDSAEFERDATALGASYFLDKARNFHRLPELLHEFVTATNPD